MLKARAALKEIYANALEANTTLDTLNEMLARGLPREIYNRYLNEAIDIGLIPVAGRSRIGDKIITEKDILKREDILRSVPGDFNKDLYWYAIG